MIQLPRLELLIATTNPGKILEIQEAFSDLPLIVRSLDDFPQISPVEEVGTTYEENAILKALNYAAQTRLCAIADDSGLEVNALGGLPGVLSARYGGASSSDEERTAKLLAEIADKGSLERGARFVCCMAFAGWKASDISSVADKPTLLNLSKGKCRGHIAERARGDKGFGYDPLFIPEGYHATFAELPAHIKGLISHRAHALWSMRDFLRHWIALT
jgi:non-canonical purine NTP pyrophosphatase (RdgB/HAM1 family)